jgi:hypothetical protein
MCRIGILNIIQIRQWNVYVKVHESNEPNQNLNGATKFSIDLSYYNEIRQFRGYYRQTDGRADMTELVSV